MSRDVSFLLSLTRSLAEAVLWRTSNKQDPANGNTQRSIKNTTWYHISSTAGLLTLPSSLLPTLFPRLSSLLSSLVSPPYSLPSSLFPTLFPRLSSLLFPLVSPPYSLPSPLLPSLFPLLYGAPARHEVAPLSNAQRRRGEM